MQNIITAVFSPGNTTTRVLSGIWQWDYGQVLRIQGLSLPTAAEVHFAHEGDAEALIRIGITKDGVTEVPFPDSILERAGDAKAYIYLSDAVSGETEYVVRFQVKEREKPEGFNGTGETTLGSIMEAVNKIAAGEINADTIDGGTFADWRNE